jgi:hypothetical protein
MFLYRNRTPRLNPMCYFHPERCGCAVGGYCSCL